MNLLRLAIKLLLSRSFSTLRIGLLRLQGAKIGRRVEIGRVSFGLNPNKLRIGDGSIIKSGVQIENIEELSIGDYVKIHADVKIEAGPYGSGRLEIGHNSWIGEGSILNCQDKMSIGANVGIGARSQLWTHGYFSSKADGYPSKVEPIEVGDGAWLPPLCIVLPGVTVGQQSIVGTGSVVVKDIPERVFATGVPCRVHQEDELQYRRLLSMDEKRHLVIDGCLSHLRKLGFRVESRQVNGEEAWYCSRFFFCFWVSGSTLHVNALKKSKTCLFVTDEEAIDGPMDHNVTVFNLRTNEYTKKGTLHEWVVVRALLDTCILRVHPTEGLLHESNRNRHSLLTPSSG